MLRALHLAALLSCAIPAQTFIVDAAGGPGSSFTDLNFAAQSVPDGSVLRVRAGTYGALFVTLKGLTVLCDPGVRIRPFHFVSPAVRIDRLPAGSSFTLQGLTFTDPVPRMVDLDQCQGPVLLDDLNGNFGTTDTFTVGVYAQDCAQVTLRDSNLTARTAVQTYDSSLVVEGCTLQGGAPVLCSGGQLVLGRSTVIGGNGVVAANGQTYGPAAGIYAVGTAMRVHDDGTGVIRAGTATFAASVPAIDGSGGSLVIDPVVPLVPYGGAPAIAATIPTTSVALPSLRAVDAPRGGTVSVDVFSPVGDAVLLFVALPGPAFPLPVFGGDTWVDPASLILVAAGVQPPTQDFGTQVPVPNTPAFEAARFTWQALGGTTAQGFRLSNPSTYVHR